MVSSPMLAPRLMPEMIMSGSSSRSPVTARWTQSVGVPFTNRKPFADLRTESGRSRVSELEAPLRSRSGATTVMLARSASVSARIAMPGAKYPSSLLSRMRIYRLVWNSGRFYSKSAPRRSENTAHVLDRGQGALQLVDVFDFAGEVHRGDVVSGLRLRRDHVGLLPHQRFGHVAQQPLPVVPANDDVHRIGLAGATAPFGADDALGKALDEAREARAVAPVHRDAASLGDDSRNPVGRRGLAAARKLGEQALDADDENPAARLPGRSTVRRNFRRGRPFRPAAQRGLQLPRADFLAPDRREKLIGLAEAQALCQLIQARGALSFALQLALDRGAAGGDDARDSAAVEPLAHLVARARAPDVAERGIEPVTARASGFGGNDLDRFRILQRIIERDDGPVHLGAAAAVADVGVQRVREVHGRRPLRQVDDLALRREHVDGVAEHGVPGLLDPVRGVDDLVAPREHLPQPGDFVVEGIAFAGCALGPFLVTPVRRHAQLRVAVHLAGADLHFQGLPLRTHNRRLQRPVQVRFRPRDVVVEFPRDRRPQVVHDAEHRVAVLRLVYQHAQAAHVVDLREIERLRAHLRIDAVQVFRPAGDLGPDAGAGELVGELGDRLFDEALAFAAAALEQAGDALVELGL